jgi:hypothetical protein
MFDASHLNKVQQKHKTTTGALMLGELKKKALMLRWIQKREQLMSLVFKGMIIGFVFS